MIEEAKESGEQSFHFRCPRRFEIDATSLYNNYMKYYYLESTTLRSQYYQLKSGKVFDQKSLITH